MLSAAHRKGTWHVSSPRSTTPPQPTGDISDRVVRHDRATTGMIVVLGGLAALAPLATDMYVPGLPAMAEDLATSPAQVQASFSVFLVGLAMGQLVLGPLSDRLGRRGILLVGIGAFVVSSLAVAAAPDIVTLHAARAVQGLAGAAGLVVGRAVVTDRSHGVVAAKQFAALTGISMVAPIVAPVLGGAILGVASWRAIFALLALVGVGLGIGILWRVPETLPPERRQHGGVTSSLAMIGRLLGRRRFVGAVLTMASLVAGLFIYLTSSAFVFQQLHGTSVTVYSVVLGVNAVGTLLGTLAFGRLVHRADPVTLLTIGSTTAAAAALGLVGLVTTTGGSVPTIWAALFVLTVAFGLALPAGVTLAQSAGHDTPGAASALVGAGQFALAPVLAPLVGLFGTTSARPMALGIAIGTLLALASTITLVRPTTSARP